MQAELFATDSPRWEPIELPGGSVQLLRGFLPTTRASLLLEQLIARVPWRQDRIRIFGKQHPLPRLQQWYGDPGQVYVWSGIRMDPLPWIPEVATIRDAVQETTKRCFNSVLLNYYRNGDDCVAWHSDDEPGLGTTPFIASVSLGAEREFQLRRVADPRERRSVLLEHGSLLTMSDETQANWQHQLPRRKRVPGPRVNLTFREFE